jgi:hypothetical protein
MNVSIQMAVKKSSKQLKNVGAGTVQLFSLSMRWLA